MTFRSDRQPRRRHVRPAPGRADDQGEGGDREADRGQGRAHDREHAGAPTTSAQIQLDAAAAQTSLDGEASTPTRPCGAMAEEQDQKVSALVTEISLNRQVYDALSKLDVSKADPRRNFYVERELRDFRLAGVDKDEPTRVKINGTARHAGQDRPGVRPQHPQRRAHHPGEQRRRCSTDYRPTSSPPQAGRGRQDHAQHQLPGLRAGDDATAKSEDVRKRLYMEYQNRAYPEEHRRCSTT